MLRQCPGKRQGQWQALGPGRRLVPPQQTLRQAELAECLGPLLFQERSVGSRGSTHVDRMAAAAVGSVARGDKYMHYSSKHAAVL